MQKPFWKRLTRRKFILGSSSALFFLSFPFWKTQPAAAAISTGILSPDERAQALLSQMKLDEKLAMLHGTSFNRGTTGYVGNIPANTRLGIPALNLEDGPVGVADGVPLVTAFPAAVAGAASWDTRLMKQYGQALGAEEYGKGTSVMLGPTVGLSKGSYEVMVGSSSRDIRKSGKFSLSQTYGPISTAVSTPETVQAGFTTTVTTTFTNGGDFTVRNVELGLLTPTNWTARSSSWPHFALVRAGQTVQIQWQIVVPGSAQPGNYTLTAQATFQGRSGEDERQNTASVSIVYASLSQAFNNVGITDDTNTSVGVFASSFFGGQSYSAEALAQVGLTPGATVTHNGVSLSWPNVAAGLPDNVQSNNQLVAFSGAGTTLAFLGASDSTTQSGIVTATYTDGSTQHASLVYASWTASSAVTGTDILVTAPYTNNAGSSTKGGLANIYVASVSLAAGKTIRFVRLPINTNLHVFALGVA